LNFSVAGDVCRRVVCAHILWLLLCASALALPGDRTLSQLYHTQWTVQDGAPTGITGIVQTRDGYIWLVAGGRLFRFDGVAFERIERIGNVPLPMEKLYAIWARPRGGLWISYVFGGATFLHEGRIENYFTNEGLPPNTVLKFAEDGTGGMWAATTRGLMRLEGGAWTLAGDGWNVPGTNIADALLDRDGTLWVVAGDELMYLRRGGRRFEAAMQVGDAGQSPASLISSPKGGGWVMRSELGLIELRTPAPGQMIAPRWRKRGFAPADRFSAALIDRDSQLWVAAATGVVRVPLGRDDDSEGHAATGNEAVQQRVSLAGESLGGMLEDREGNIWIVTNGGLDKFRTAAFVNAPLPAGAQQPALAAANDGSVWIGTAGATLHRFELGIEREWVRAPVLIEALHHDSEGTLWVGGVGNSIWHRRAGDWVQWRPKEREPAIGIQAIASEPGGALWVSVARGGVYRVIDNRWTLWGGLTDLPPEPATTLAFDSNRRLWLGYVNSRVAVLDRDGVTVYSAASGLTTGAVQAIAQRGENFWIGGERGVVWFDGRRFHSLEGPGQRAFTGVNGIVEQANGDLWLNSSEGAVRIPATEVRSFVADPRRRVQFQLLNYLDGMPGAPVNIRPLSSVVEDGAGRLWFASTKGVVSLAPGPLPSNSVVPNVYIKSVIVDAKRYDLDDRKGVPLRLPTNPRDLQIAYTALSFSIPERVHFRYLLEGTSMGWQDVGTRREAYFTELPPGSYRFKVIASNDAGIWNETGAMVEFVIPTTFLQSREFIVLCVVSASTVLWLLYLFRVRQVKAQLHSRNDERLRERERIARDLHDTFLQGIHGLILRFQTATERIPPDEPARKLMEDALDRADRVLAEGRDKVAELRASISTNLPESLAMVGSDLSLDCSTAFESKVEGTPRALNPLMQEEAYRIGIEALANAFRHARATHVYATVEFGRRYFIIRVADDGVGFDLSNRKPGRWGLKGMRERAEKIRGRLTVASQPDAGTTVELQVPAKLAYKRAERSRWNWLSRFRATKTESST
jgi:signal transduction histidine kinase/ligand-binding sensor domain-containing protein